MKLDTTAFNSEMRRFRMRVKICEASLDRLLRNLAGEKWATHAFLKWGGDGYTLYVITNLSYRDVADDARIFYGNHIDIPLLAGFEVIDTTIQGVPGWYPLRDAVRVAGDESFDERLR